MPGPTKSSCATCHSTTDRSYRCQTLATRIAHEGPGLLHGVLSIEIFCLLPDCSVPELFCGQAFMDRLSPSFHGLQLERPSTSNLCCRRTPQPGAPLTDGHHLELVAGLQYHSVQVTIDITSSKDAISRY